MHGTLCSPLSRWFSSVACGALVCLLGNASPGFRQTVDETGHPDSMLVGATGTHRFCLEGGAGLTLLDDRGAAWLTSPVGEGWVKASLLGLA